MKKTNKIIGATLALAAITVASTSFAYQGNPAVQGPDYSPERHADMTVAFEQNDYDAWKELTVNNKGRITEVITADNFAQFVEAHELAKSGDLDGAKEIREELGLGMKNGEGRGQGQGKNQGQGMKDGSGQKNGGGRTNQ